MRDFPRTPDPAVLRSSPSPAITAAADSEKPSRLRKWRRRLPSLIPAALFVAVYIVSIVLFIVYRKQAIPHLLDFGHTIKGLGFGGVVIVVLCVFLTSFPPIPGYGILTGLSGVIYGWIGFFPVYIGAALGAFTCFGLFRRFSFNYAQRLVDANPKASAAVRAMEAQGFKMLFFVRLAPYPYNLMNSLFGASRVPFWHFAVATLLTLPKILVDVLLGANLAIVSSSLLDHPTVVNWVIFSVLALIAISVTLWIGWVARRAVKRMEEEEARLRLLNVTVEGSSSSGSSTEDEVVAVEQV